jgi:multimeric flavodoxin WrbA
MSKVLIVLSSPRKNGNSTILAEKAAEGIAAAGGTSETIRLSELNIRPCQACGHCRRDPGGCIVDDDMQRIYPMLNEADALLISSPIYMFNISAQLKLFMDRCYAVPQALVGMRVGVVLAYAGDDEYDSGAINAINALKDEYEYAQSKLVGIVHGSADEKGEIKKSTALLEQAVKLGKALIG